jgi:hypothetical protein
MMHHNAQLLEKLFTSLDKHDHPAMADCYYSGATFKDIAFHLRNKKQIHAMWHMICEGDIRATAKVIHADDQAGQVELVGVYTFRETGNKVRNEIISHFKFRNGLIVEHDDSCDARKWADQAFKGPKGFLVGRSRSLRSLAARNKLTAFIEKHAEYK